MSETRPLCVFVHGWGMNHAIWQPVIDALPAGIDAVAVDLPGHGESAASQFASLEDLVEALRRDISRPAIWIGWSLGGLAVLKLALDFPRHVQAMMLVASTPCFVRRDDWSYGMPQSVFDSFALALETDLENTIRRFLALQVKDSAHGRQLLKKLRQQVLQQPPANMQALRAGLAVLKDTDLRTQMPALAMPLSIALGARDGLVNAESATLFTNKIPHADVRIYAQAAHAPFLSHLPEFSAQLTQLVRSLHDKQH